MNDALYNPPDMEIASEHHGAMCGHGALAAAIGVPVTIVMLNLFPAGGGWMNIPMMKGAISRAEHAFTWSASLPDTGTGVAMVQWLGPWMREGVPIRARCAHRHWIAFRPGLIWDANLQDWVPREAWTAWVPTIYGPRVTGHTVASVLSITPITTPQPAI